MMYRCVGGQAPLYLIGYTVGRPLSRCNVASRQFLRFVYRNLLDISHGRLADGLLLWLVLESRSVFRTISDHLIAALTVSGLRTFSALSDDVIQKLTF